MVGNLLLDELMNAGTYGLIKIFVRNSAGVSSPAVQEIITDFADTQELKSAIKGDDLFICLGTTIKKAGSVANMEKVDRDLPVMIAGSALSNGVKRIAVVSSIGTKTGSSEGIK